MDRAAVAARLGIHPDSVTRYLTETRAKLKRDEQLDPSDLPQPDGYAGKSPWWWPATIEAWVPARPPKGAGAGRPRKDREGSQSPTRPGRTTQQ